MQHASSVLESGIEEDPEGLDEVLQALAQPFDSYLLDIAGVEMGQDYWGQKYFFHP